MDGRKVVDMAIVLHNNALQGSPGTVAASVTSNGWARIQAGVWGTARERMNGIQGLWNDQFKNREVSSRSSRIA